MPEDYFLLKDRGVISPDHITKYDVLGAYDTPEKLQKGLEDEVNFRGYSGLVTVKKIDFNVDIKIGK